MNRKVEEEQSRTREEAARKHHTQPARPFSFSRKSQLQSRTLTKGEETPDCAIPEPASIENNVM